MKLEQLPLATQLLYKKLDELCIGTRIIPIEIICGLTALSDATVRRHITKLKASGYIEVYREKRGIPYSFKVRRVS